MTALRFQTWGRHQTSPAGRSGIGKTNNRGWRLLGFAKSHLANTPHSNKLSRAATWQAPNRQVHNQTDFILIPERFKSSINEANTRTFPGADTDSNHDLVLSIIKLKVKVKHLMKSPHIRFDLEKLKDQKIAEVFQAKVDGKFAALCIFDSDLDTLLTSQVLLSTAEEVLGRQRKKIQTGVTNQVMDL